MSGNDGGVFVYHPLHSQTPLYSVYDTAIQGPAPKVAHTLSPDDQTRLLKRYRIHMRDVIERRGPKSGFDLEKDFKDDARDLVQRFRAFFPALLSKTTLTEHAAQAAIFFPTIECFDNRCIEIKGHNEAIFITSRTLDAIELFADTLSMCIALNGPELSALLALENPPPPHVLLAWMTMNTRPTPDVLMLDSVLGPGSRRLSEEALREELYTNERAMKWLPEANRNGWGHYRLSMALTWLMLVAINRLVRGAQLGGEHYLGVTIPRPGSTSMLSLDSRYLSTLILSFIVLHEIGHFALGHNNAAGPPVDPVLQKIVDASLAHAGETGTEAQNLIGSFVGHETAADGFALDVIENEYRDPMLEAATLWCAALAGTNDDCGDWLDHFGANPRGNYPAFSMRVWFMNGRFSEGKRKGRIAQDITRQAEALARTIRQDEQPARDSAGVFLKLWQIAEKQTSVENELLDWLQNQLGKPKR